MVLVHSLYLVMIPESTFRGTQIGGPAPVTLIDRPSSEKHLMWVASRRYAWRGMTSLTEDSNQNVIKRLLPYCSRDPSRLINTLPGNADFKWFFFPLFPALSLMNSPNWIMLSMLAMHRASPMSGVSLRRRQMARKRYIYNGTRQTDRVHGATHPDQAGRPRAYT